MAEYMKAIPSMSTVAESPGRNEVVFRGVSTGSGAWRIESGSAVYLGDIPMTSATQAVDPRTVDVARIEALPGPQGTLFGSSSQSGALRIIPNQPDTSGGYGSIEVAGTYMSEGSPGHSVEGFVNLPLVEDKLAVRAVIFDSKSGGYIDNVLGENVFTTETNADVVEEDFNEWEQTGGRIAALWNISDEWDVELMYMNQSQTSQGDWKSDPNRDDVGDLEIVRFHKDVREDDWWIGALTITGDVGFAEFKSVTSVLDREIFYDFDGTPDGQIRSQKVLTPGEYTFDNVWYDTSFHQETWVNDQTAERVTQEFRLVSTGDSRLEWMIGAFYEKTEDKWDYAFANVENFSETAFGQYWEYWYFELESDVWYKEDYEATTEQIAVFGEVNFALTDDLSATVGARWFEYDRERYEQKHWPEGNVYEIDTYQGKDDDTLFKFSLNYNLTDDKMVYALASEGFRLGGFNSIKNPGSVLPDTYDSDELRNFEIGMKSRWLDNRLQLNAALYRMEWKDIQRGITDPDDWSANGTVNMGDADINGFELDVSYYVNDQFKANLAYAYNDSEMDGDKWLSDIVDLTEEWQDDQLAADGQSLAIAPPKKWWVGLEYTIPDAFPGLDAWMRYDHTWSDAMYHDWWNAMNAQTGYGGRKLIDEGHQGNVSMGLGKAGSWSVMFSVWNIFDERNEQWVASWYDGDLGPTGTFAGVNKYVNMPSYNRPREYSLSFRKDFEF
jgi:outer membrane receptor protein involved in Fe transport